MRRRKQNDKSREKTTTQIPYKRIPNQESADDQEPADVQKSVDVDIEVTYRWHKAAKKTNQDHPPLAGNGAALMSNPPSRFNPNGYYIGVIVLDSYAVPGDFTSFDWVISHGFSQENSIERPIENPAFVAKYSEIREKVKEKFELCSEKSGTVYLFEMTGDDEIELRKLIDSPEKIQILLLNTLDHMDDSGYKSIKKEWQFKERSKENSEAKFSVSRSEESSSSVFSHCIIM